MSTRLCLRCGNSFTGPSRQKWCDACNMVTFNCATCGKPKTVRRSRYEQSNPSQDQNHFCSIRCAQLNMTKAAAKQRMNGSMIICPNCGKENYRSEADQERIFCDHDCYMEYRCNHPEKYPSQFEKPEIHAKAMATRKRRGTNWSLGRTGPKSIFWKGGTTQNRGTSWSVIRELIIDRDQAQCSLCHISQKHRQLDVHHIVEWVEEKCNHPFNLITVCQQCHRSGIHGNSPAPYPRELVAIARQSTLEHLSRRDFQYILERDAEQRDNKPLSQQTVDLLNLTSQSYDIWKQGQLF